MTPTQTDEFVPLVASAASARQDFQITVIPQKGEPQPFQSLDKKAAATSFKKNCEPQLTMQRDGGRITNIRVECSCGQTIDIACVYEEPPKP